MRVSYSVIKYFFFLIALISFDILCKGQSKWYNLTGVNTIEKIIDDHPYLWMATDGGLLKYNKNSGEIKKYTKANADLPGNRLSSIVINGKTLWLGTRYEGIGLGEFNENECAIYNPNNSGLKLFTDHSALAIDESGQLWIGERFNITSFDGKHFTSYNCPINPTMSNTGIIQLLTDGDIIYASGTWNLSGLREIKEHDSNSYLKFLIGSSGMICDNDGKLYFSQGDGLIIYDHGTWSELTTANSDIPTNKLGIGAKDQQGNLWFTSNLGIVKFNHSSFDLFSFPENENTLFLTMCIDVENTIWLGGLSGDLFKFKNYEWEKINVNDNPFYSVINQSMAYDSGGNLWISTLKREGNAEWENYLLKYEGTYFQKYNKSEILNLDAQIVFEDTERSILTFDNLLFEYKDSTWYIHDLGKSEIASNFARDNNGIIWEATTTGLKRYQNQNYTIYTTDNSNLPTNSLCKIAIDKQGDFIISNCPSSGEKAYLFEFVQNNSTILFTSENENQLINAFVIENDNIWFGVRDRTMKNDGEGLFKLSNGTIINFNEINSNLPSNAIDVLYLDDINTLWANANGGGIVRIKENKWTVFDLFNSALPSLNNLSIASNRDYIAVLSVSEGITLIPDNALLNSNNIQKKNANHFIIFPNPVYTNSWLTFNLLYDAKVSAEVIDLNGRTLSVVIERQTLKAGPYIYNLNLPENIHGVFLVKLLVNNNVNVKRIVVQ